MNLFGLLFGWNGRVNRRQFWLLFAVQTMFAYVSLWLMAYIALSLAGIVLGTSGLSVLRELAPLDIRRLGVFLLGLAFGAIPILFLEFMLLVYYLFALAIARDGMAHLEFTFIAMLLAFELPLLHSTIVVGIKRLHDRDESGWRLVIYYLGSVILGYVLPISGIRFATMSMIVGIAIWVWAMADLGLRRGTAGENEYGLDPSPNG